MRLPSGPLIDILPLFLGMSEFSFIGCLSFEERCCAVPIYLFDKFRFKNINMIEVIDPSDAFPDYCELAAGRIEVYRKKLNNQIGEFSVQRQDLLAGEDLILSSLDSICNGGNCTVILDITCFPKRFFCLFVKRLMLDKRVSNVIVTYTFPGYAGHADGHLAEDPMTCDHLPGFSAQLNPRDTTLVISIGFENLSIASLLEVYRDKMKVVKFIMPCPPLGNAGRRAWNTLRRMVSDDTQNLHRGNIEVISAWDTEQAYKQLNSWLQDATSLILAPFGPKPITLGMALFATKNDIGMYYTQPKAYNPDYSRGSGASIGYVLKWNSIACYDRESSTI